MKRFFLFLLLFLVIGCQAAPVVPFIRNNQFTTNANLFSLVPSITNYMRLTNTAAASSYVDIGPTGVTNVGGAFSIGGQSIDAWSDLISGSATNVNFISGQGTTYVQVNGSNTFHVTGTLTNDISGNAATATDAQYAIDSITARDLLDTDGVVAVDVTLTKVVITPSHQLLGDGGGLTQVVAVAVSGPLTNQAQTFVYNSLAEAVQSPYTNGTIEFIGYWGNSNTIGGGRLRYVTNAATAATTNLGTVFAASVGGSWLRVPKDGPRVFRLEDFGARPMNSDSPTTTHNSAHIISNCVATAGNYSKIIWPNFWVGGWIVLSNAVGVTIEGERGSHGANLSYPTIGPGLAYMGATNGTLVKMWNARECVIRGLGLDVNTPIQPSLGQPITNHADVGIDIDQVTPAAQISTHNIIENNYIRVRQTNVVFYGVKIAATSPNNCEQMLLRNNYITGGKYYDNGALDGSIHSQANEGTGIFVGNSPNARGWDFDNNNIVHCRYGYWIKNGGGIIRGGAKMGGLSEFDLRIDAWTWPVTVEGIGTEASKHFALLGSGSGGMNATTPITFINCASETSGIRHTTNPVVVVNGSATINMMGCLLGGPTNQTLFQVSNIYTATLYAQGNTFPAHEFEGKGFDGFQNFSIKDNLRVTVADNSFGNDFKRNSKDYRWTAAYSSNLLASFIFNNSLWLNPTNARLLLGPVGAVEQSERFAYHPGNVGGHRWVWGDTGILRRVELAMDAAVGSTVLSLFSSNSTGATIQGREYSGGDFWGLTAGFNRVDQWFGGALYRHRSGGVNGQEWLTVLENTSITLASTNNSITLNSTNVVVNGTGRFASNIVAGLGVVVSNATASSIAVFDAAKNLTNGTIGTGLTLVNGVLSATGGGGGVAWSDITSKPDVVTNGYTESLTLSNASTTLRGTLQVAGATLFSNNVTVFGTLLATNPINYFDTSGNQDLWLDIAGGTKLAYYDAGDDGIVFGRGAWTDVDNAYDPTFWNGSLRFPTENAVRDHLVTLAPLTSPSFTGTASFEPDGTVAWGIGRIVNALVISESVGGQAFSFTAAGLFSAPSLAGSGSGITALNAASLASGVIPDARMPDLTGDVTTSEGAVATTIANDAVTYAKMQNVSATSRVLGRKTSGAGDTEEMTASEVLNFIGSTRGSLLYSGASGWTVLTPGTSGYFLKSAGAGADPFWDAVSGGSVPEYANGQDLAEFVTSDSAALKYSDDTIAINIDTVSGKYIQLQGDVISLRYANGTEMVGLGGGGPLIKSPNTTVQLVVADSGVSILGGSFSAITATLTGSPGLTLANAATSAGVLRIDEDDDNGANYAEVTVGNLTGARTITLPDATGTVLLTDGSGASLTALNASALGSGTVADARLTANVALLDRSPQLFTGTSNKFVNVGVTGGVNANTAIVTNRLRQPFAQLTTSGDVTNYVIDFAATVPNNHRIMATGNVYFVSIDNIEDGVVKNLVITNVYKALSNITVYVQTNLLHLGPTNGWFIGASPMHTNRGYSVTNSLVLSLQSIGSTAPSIAAFAVHNTP